MSTVAPPLNGCRVLVVGINYAPEHTGIAPYTTEASDHFVSRGAQVLALAGVPHYPHWTVPREYRTTLRVTERRGSVDVRRLRHVVPTSQSAIRRSAYEGTFGLHVLAQRLPWRPDVVLAVVPSLAGAAAAAAIAKRTSAPLVLWVQDLMGPAAAQSGIAGGGGIAALAGALENRVAQQAAAVVVVSSAFAPYLTSHGVVRDHVHVVPNWTHVQAAREERAAVRQRLGWADDEIVALHSGNMGLKQGLENVLAAARMANAPLRLVLMGDGNQREHLARLGDGVPRLDLLPPAPSSDFPDVLAAADVLLVNERGSAVDMSLPSKLTSYFSSGRPVVAAVPAGGGTAAEVERSRGGVVIPPEDPAALVAALEALAADPARRASLGAAGKSHARENLNRAASLERLTSILLSAMEERAGSG